MDSFKELVGSWFARETALVKVRARPNDPSAERIHLAPCQRFPLEKMRVCAQLYVYPCFYQVVACRPDLSVLCLIVGWSETLPDTPVDEMPPGPEVPEKIKKRYRKKKTKLEEAFPTYLQVCHLWCKKDLTILSCNWMYLYIWMNFFFIVLIPKYILRYILFVFKMTNVDTTYWIF